jgi:CRP-like cAMP-binding protein
MPSNLGSDPKQNRILATLPKSEYARLHDDLEAVSLDAGLVIYDAGDVLEYVYFPTTCIVALVSTTESGSSAILALTGNDGLLGIPLVLADNRNPHRVVVQSAGLAYRVKAEVMRWELNQHCELNHISLLYTQALLAQMAQSVVCNRHHSVEQRLCRWLLLILDQQAGHQIDLTQEAISNMLGVRRETVTEAAGKLQNTGVLEYNRGHIKIIDRPALETRACECYFTVNTVYKRLFQYAPTNVDTPNRGRPNPATLRKRAEKRLKQDPPDTPMTSWDQVQLMHELQVHQVELEMQIEALSNSYEDADALRARYADIYDFSPVAYFTLDSQGMILDLNLAGSILLGIKNAQKSRHRFAAFVEPESLPVFNRFFENVLLGIKTSYCEIMLAPTTRHPAMQVKIQAVTNEGKSECRMVVMPPPGGKINQAGLSARLTPGICRVVESNRIKPDAKYARKFPCRSDNTRMRRLPGQRYREF